MEKFRFNKLGQNVLYDKMKNGLEVYLLPQKIKKDYYISIGVKFGSNDVEFIPIDQKEYVKMPCGIAHFLEHKMFEMKDGTDPFAFFSKSGSNVNAGTNFYTTKYYVWGNKNLYVNFEYLLNCLFSPYFTDDNVIKEQNIIKEEIEMYKDNLNWVVDDTMRRLLFNVLPVKDSIAGEVEDIMKITKEDLYTCYRTFYQPSNMVLMIGGNFDADKILSIIANNDNLQQATTNKTITRKKYLEPLSVFDEYQQIKYPIVIPKFKYAFKFKRDDFSIKDKVLLDIYLSAIISICFGSTSLFLEKSMLNNLTTGFYVEHSYYDDFCIIEIDAESDKADLFKEAIDNYINNLSISEDDLKRIKKVFIASEIKLSDSLDVLIEGIFSDCVYYGKTIYNRINLIKTINLKTMQKIISEISFNDNCLVLLIPV